MDGQEHIVPVVGPLSTSLEGIKIFMKKLIDQKPWLYEPSLVPMPWQDSVKQGSLLRNSLNGKTLRIGVLLNDGILKPHPPILRAMSTLRAELTNTKIMTTILSHLTLPPKPGASSSVSTSPTAQPKINP